MDKLSDKALQLIWNAEGLDQPKDWPGGQSGITIGIGYDLGYVTVDQFESDWGDVLDANTCTRLQSCIGLRGSNAKVRASALSNIHIDRNEAEKVFEERTLSVCMLKTEQAFPGFDNFPADAQGALVSLVYNRGTSMIDTSPEDRRREMRAIRDAVAHGDL
jgi:GH24 family phage-related lysozyme (muramidase)